MIELKPDYREVMVYQIYLAIGFLVLPFSLLALWREQYLLSLPPLLTAVLCLINAACFYRRRRFCIHKVVISLLYIADVIVVVRELGAVGAYWTYPTMLALYWVHRRRVAIYLVAVFYLGVCIASWHTLPPETALRIGATLLTTAVFFNIGSGILEQQYEDLKKLTVTDHLTGAFNRRFMDQKIDELIERQRRSSAQAAMIALDIDHFKKINDRYGHSQGDRVLVDVVNLIRARIRVLDCVCRAGGEEFIIILPDTSEPEARSVGDELRRSIQNTALLKGSQVTVSCGVSSLILGDDRDSWLHRCDLALYAAKRRGRNTVAVDQSTEALPAAT